MPQSKNADVQNFLEKFETTDSEKYAIVTTMRDIVFSVHPNVSERIMYGGIMFTSTQDWGGLFVSQEHVSFEFSQGVTFKDPKHHLEGTGKFRRHLKIKSLDDIITKEVEYYVKQVV